VLLGWQVFEKLTSEQLPAAVLAGYFKTYGLQSLLNKAKNAAALTGHLGWLGFPALAWLAAARSKPLLIAGAAAALAAALIDPHPLYLLAASAGAIVLALCLTEARHNWLAQWILLFFAAALVLFFAGSARYLLPLAVPLCILLADRGGRWVWPSIAVQAALSLALAFVNYQHWDTYRTLVARHASDWQTQRVWVNAEWGLRHYAETEGALPVVRGQAVRPGDLVITSKLSLPVDFTTGGGALVPLEQTVVRPSLPLRLIGLGSRSAYSTADAGFRPFDTGSGPVDEVTIHAVVERKPSRTHLLMSAPEAAEHIVSGIDKVEDNRYRWMGRRAVLLLKNPNQPSRLQVELYVSEGAAARQLSITVDGVPAGTFPLPKSGPYTALTEPLPALPATRESATVAIEVDRTFQVPGDQRTLGVILTSAGFVPATP
jgi:hypothetical protein